MTDSRVSGNRLTWAGLDMGVVCVAGTPGHGVDLAENIGAAQLLHSSVLGLGL